MARRSRARDGTRSFIHLPDAALRREWSARRHADADDARPYLSRTHRSVLIGNLFPEELDPLRAQGARLFPNVRFAPGTSDRTGSGDGLDDGLDGGAEADIDRLLDWSGNTVEAAGLKGLSMDDVLDHIKAPAAWQISRGDGVTIVIVDTGVSSGVKEIPPEKRSSIDLPTAYRGRHWLDDRGHGTMCAAIAAGTRRRGGRYDGVAPQARILSARTSLKSDDLYEIYDALLGLRGEGRLPGPVVISNSYSLRTCAPPPDFTRDHPLVEIVRAAVGEGIPVVFGAGNHHAGLCCNHDPTSRELTTIWGVNSLDEVITVGTVGVIDGKFTNQDARLPHANSSRGPGQWAVRNLKPDCVAPTFGEVVWGAGYRRQAWWGTSGAAPRELLAALAGRVRQPWFPTAHGHDTAACFAWTPYLYPAERVDAGWWCSVLAADAGWLGLERPGLSWETYRRRPPAAVAEPAVCG